MVSTIIILLLIALFVYFGIRRGAARTLLKLAATFISAMLANWLGYALSQVIYDNFIKATVVKNIDQLIRENGESFASEHSLMSLPDGLERIVDAVARMFGVTSADLQGRIVASTANTENMARAIEAPLGALAVTVLGILLMIVFFLLFGIILNIIAGKIALAFELPVIGTVNRVLGGVLGAVEGLVIAFAAVNIVYLLMSYANPVLAENKNIFGGLFDALLLFR